jgi:two-component system response regulator FixJ
MTPTIFVIDDDAAMRESLEQLLVQVGFKVQIYADGAKFLAACGEDIAGCVLLDVSMPGMTGQQVQMALAERGLEIPIIFLTAHGDVPMAVRAMQDGAVDFLMKPIRAPLLFERVRRALSLDEQRRQALAETRNIQQRYARLTPREKQVMEYVVAGLTNKAIARELGLSPRTVELHRIHVMQKMGADNLVDLLNQTAHCRQS